MNTCRCEIVQQRLFELNETIRKNLGPTVTLARDLACRFTIPETGIAWVGFRHIASELSHQIDNSHAERIRNDFQGLNRNVAFPALNLPYMCAVQS